MATIGYNEETDLTAYCAARGIVLARPEAETLQLALDWLELQPFAGSKTDPLQELEWPRTGIAGVDTETVPAKIKQAQLVAAVIYDGGGDPQGAIGPRVTQETVFGAVSVSYSDTGNQTTLYPQLNALLRPFTGGLGGSQFNVSRG